MAHLFWLDYYIILLYYFILLLYLYYIILLLLLYFAQDNYDFPLAFIPCKSAFFDKLGQPQGFL